MNLCNIVGGLIVYVSLVVAHSETRDYGNVYWNRPVRNPRSIVLTASTGFGHGIRRLHSPYISDGGSVGTETPTISSDFITGAQVMSKDDLVQSETKTPSKHWAYSTSVYSSPTENKEQADVGDRRYSEQHDSTAHELIPVFEQYDSDPTLLVQPELALKTDVLDNVDDSVSDEHDDYEFVDEHVQPAATQTPVIEQQSSILPEDPTPSQVEHSETPAPVSLEVYKVDSQMAYNPHVPSPVDDQQQVTQSTTTEAPTAVTDNHRQPMEAEEKRWKPMEAEEEWYRHVSGVEHYSPSAKVEAKEPTRTPYRSTIPWAKSHVGYQPYQIACQQELDRGKGPDEVSSWYYDSRQGRCIWFGYRGYGGSANRFYSRKACEEHCINGAQDLCQNVRCSFRGTHCVTVGDESCKEYKQRQGKDFRLTCPPDQPVCLSRRNTRIAPDVDSTQIPTECFQPADPGTCQKKNPAVNYFYDRERNDCMTFYFHDCGGNDNRFLTKSDCMSHCSP